MADNFDDLASFHLEEGTRRNLGFYSCLRIYVSAIVDLCQRHHFVVVEILLVSVTVNDTIAQACTRVVAVSLDKRFLVDLRSSAVVESPQRTKVLSHLQPHR